MFEIMEAPMQEAVIKVIGVGGCGGNAVDHMIVSGLDGVEFICANTDAQALKRSQARTQLQLGAHITKGLGAGANPEIGRASAMEDRERIAEMIQGANMLFITAGMGGGTGTGAAPIVAEVAKELGILTVAVVTKPFAFEGKRSKVAQLGMETLAQHVDSLIVVPNDKLMQVLGEDVSFQDAFKAANDVLHGAVSGIAEVINCPGLVNVDFADVKTVMSENGMAMMGSATASGVDRARIAAERAVASPLLEDIDLAGARGVLVNITASMSLKMKEYYEVMETIKEFTAEDATVIVGTVHRRKHGRHPARHHGRHRPRRRGRPPANQAATGGAQRHRQCPHGRGLRSPRATRSDAQKRARRAARSDEAIRRRFPRHPGLPAQTG